jgi:DNA-binding NtrC family response regulator
MSQITTFKSRVLLVEDEANARSTIQAYLEACGYETLEADSCKAAIGKLTADVPDIVLLDFTLPDGTALDLLRHLKAQSVDVPAIVLTGNGSIEAAVAAIKEGADQFLTKPIELASLAVVIDRAIEHKQNSRRLDIARARAQGHGDVFNGRSAAIQRTCKSARQRAEARASGRSRRRAATSASASRFASAPTSSTP